MIVHAVRVAKDDHKGTPTEALREQHFEEFFEGHKNQTDK
jgi:hypothetical protein